MMTIALLALPAAANDIDDNPNAFLTAASLHDAGVAPGRPVEPRFAVRVSDNAGHPKAGVRVSFAVDVPHGLPGQPIPPLQPSYGSFEGSFPDTADVRTDANGLATAPPFIPGSADDRYYDVSATVDPAADAQTPALIGDGEMARHFRVQQFAAAIEPECIIVAPTVEGSDVSILPGGSADVTVTIRNTTSTTSPELTFQLHGSYHYALLTPDGCGPLTPVFMDQTTARGHDRPCATRCSATGLHPVAATAFDDVTTERSRDFARHRAPHRSVAGRGRLIKSLDDDYSTRTARAGRVSRRLPPIAFES